MQEWGRNCLCGPQNAYYACARVIQVTVEQIKEF